MGYFGNIYDVSKSIVTGMGVTLKHLLSPGTITTIHYKRPERRGPGSGHQLPMVPVAHRGLHYLETEACIMCWQCSNICPVDCIVIEGTRDGEIEGGYEGKNAVMSRFTIDYALCIFCNLCCEVCPETSSCIHMGQEWNTKSHEETKLSQFDSTPETQADLVKNLLTDNAFTGEDFHFTKGARKEIDALAAEKKRKQEEAKLARLAAKKAAAAKKDAAAKKAAAVTKTAPAKKGGSDAKSAAAAEKKDD